jgi:hypothetical protein
MREAPHASVHRSGGLAFFLARDIADVAGIRRAYALPWFAIGLRVIRL